jgi:hypothetical protein
MGAGGYAGVGGTPAVPAAWSVAGAPVCGPWFESEGEAGITPVGPVPEGSAADAICGDAITTAQGRSANPKFTQLTSAILILMDRYAIDRTLPSST